VAEFVKLLDFGFWMSQTTGMTSTPISIHYNDRNYNPPEWEAWKASEVIAHAQDLTLLTDKYPSAVIVSPK
jgi:hypothetical protein